MKKTRRTHEAVEMRIRVVPVSGLASTRGGVLSGGTFKVEVGEDHYVVTDRDTRS